MMRRIAICDDEKKIVDFIDKECREFYKKNKVYEISKFYSGEDLIESNEHFDIIFMDMEMKMLNGLETAQEIRKTQIDTLIIVVSGYEKYKMDCYSIQAFEFIVKPIDSMRLCSVLEKAENFYSTIKENKYVYFKTSEGNYNFNIEDILYFVYELRVIKLISTKGEFALTSSRDMESIFNELEPYGFAQSHRGYIVNMANVTSVLKTDIIVGESVKIPLSRRKSKDFRKAYTKFIGMQLE